MKNFIICCLILVTLPSAQPIYRDVPFPTVTPTPNLFIITVDGFRWQELFSGADPRLINDTLYTPDTATMKMLYWSEDEKERRQKLMPFFWSILSRKGQLYGNRNLDNKINTANIYSVSYPGYNELLTGTTDFMISSNKRRNNPNPNVLDYLDSREGFKGKVVAFTSWDVFPYILNEERSNILINSGYKNMDSSFGSPEQSIINRIQSTEITEKGGTRYDQLTFLTAREYIKRNRPRVALIGLGETDEFAHGGRYDLYLEQANKTDRMIAEFWHWIQTTPGYKDNTTLLITTDHGRGRNEKWTSHSGFIKGASQTWLALLGPTIEGKGEIREGQQHYQQEIAGLIASLVGEDFKKRAASSNQIASSNK